MKENSITIEVSNMKPEDLMNWDNLSESFGRITTESNSTHSSLEDITKTNTLSDNNVDITELLFDNSINNNNKLTEVQDNIVVDNYDLSGLDVVSLSPFDGNEKDDASNKTGNNHSVTNEMENTWVDVSELEPINVEISNVNDKLNNTEVKLKAMQLALANEIEVQAPWVDVSALAASISETPVSIKDKTPENIFTLATFVPTHMQSYIDLNIEAIPTANVLTENAFELQTPNIHEISDKVFNDTELVSNLETSKLDDEIDNILKDTLNSHALENDRLLSTPSPTKVQQNIEINPANSVLFNTDLDLEDTLLFNSEPPSDMYVVRTENIFGKEIAKRNALEKLAADAGICSCRDCRCNPNEGECQCADTESVNQGCTEDKCSCVDCKCDHATMRCVSGCGLATDTNHNTFLHYHRRHNSSSLEELGVYTLDEPAGEEIIDNLKCSCNNNSESASESCCSKSTNDNSKDSCCSKKSSNETCCVTICLKKLESFKQLLLDKDVVSALKSRSLNITTSL